MSRGIRLLSFFAVILLPVLALAQNGSISGTVIDESTFAPILGAHVAAKTGSGPYPHLTLGTAVTDSSGNYTMSDLPPETYVVVACRQGFECEFYNNSPTLGGAAPVPVDAGAVVAGIDFSLTASQGGGTGAISGRVTDEATSLPLSGVGVVAKSSSGNHDVVAGAMTDMNGDYTIHNLPEGDYYVGACKPHFICELYDNVTDPASATLVHVTAGAVTSGIDFTLVHQPSDGSGTISGTVTDSFTAQPIAGAKVLAFNNQGMHFKACTDPTGHYSMNVPAGSYALVAWAHDYHPAIYPGVVTVNDGDNIIINFQLIPFAFGAIAGNVTEAITGNPIQHALQIAKKMHGRGFGWAFSDESGDYLIDHLPTGFYHVVSIAQGYHLSIYPDSVEVQPFSTAPGINFQLQPKIDSVGMVAGRTANGIDGILYDDSSGLPLSFGIVVAVARVDSSGFVLRFAFADSSGAYSIDDLQTLNYYLLAWSPGYMAELYNDAHSIESATLVTPPDSGVNFYLAKCPDGPFAINGRVVPANNPGTGLTGVIVNAYDQSGQLSVSAYSLPPFGTYTLEGLEPGNYTIEVSSYFGTATPQQVSISNQDANEVNFTISGSGMRGDVTSDGKITLADVITIINALFRPQQFPPVSVQQADVNCSGTVTLGDPIYLINYLMRGGTVPCNNP